MAIFQIKDYPIQAPQSEKVECTHTWEFRRVILSNGVELFCLECQSCFQRSAKKVGKKKALMLWGKTEAECDEAQGVDPDGRERWFKNIYYPTKTNQKAEWWEWYEGYLGSAEWLARRMAVLQRDGGMCCGIGCNRTATQVHHLTYARVGRENLDDLCSTCDDCHEKAHSYRRRAPVHA